MLTLQDLLDRLLELPLSARTALVYIDVGPDESGEQSAYWLPISVRYQNGDVTIETEEDGT